ncbi:PAAR domain-containing protein [Actinoplanes sp. NPDC051859]
MAGSPTVLINGKPAARTGDKVPTCNDPAPVPTSTIIAVDQVLIG